MCELKREEKIRQWGFKLNHQLAPASRLLYMLASAKPLRALPRPPPTFHCFKTIVKRDGLASWHFLAKWICQ